MNFDGEPVVRGVDLAVAEGELLALMGPNGAGKSTLLRAIAGFERTAEGSIRLDGADLRGTPPHRRKIGLLFQDPALFPNRTVFENVAYAPLLQRRPDREVRAEVGRLAALLSLEPLLDRRPAELSGGERQRTALARTLAARPRLVLLDEPFASVDVEVKATLRTEFRAALRASGTAAIHVTHDRDEGLFLGDRVALLFGGELEATGTPPELYRSPRDGPGRSVPRLQRPGRSGRDRGGPSGRSPARPGTRPGSAVHRRRYWLDRPPRADRPGGPRRSAGRSVALGRVAGRGGRPTDLGPVRARARGNEAARHGQRAQEAPEAGRPMSLHDPLSVTEPLPLGGSTPATVYRVSRLKGVDPARLARTPRTVQLILENVLRHYRSDSIDVGSLVALAHREPAARSVELPFYPERVLLQDFTGIPVIVDLATLRDAAARGHVPPERINPVVPVDLVVDHSVQVDSYNSPRSVVLNLDREYERNSERYRFLQWTKASFSNLRVVPPGNGICHQVNLEYLASVVALGGDPSAPVAYPDTVIGTDSHTTMVNGLSVLGWGVGGIEAEAVMLGEPYFLARPEVVGVELTGSLPTGTTATDLVLTVTRRLREKGVVDKFVEFFGPASGRSRCPTAPPSRTCAPSTGRRPRCSPSTRRPSSTFAPVAVTARSWRGWKRTPAPSDSGGLPRRARSTTTTS